MSDVPVAFAPSRHYSKYLESRVAVLEQIAKTTAATLERPEQLQDRMLERMDRRFDAMDRKFDAMDRKFEAKFDVMDQPWMMLNTRHRQDFLWVIAIQIATVGGLLTAITRGFPWL